jgi:hypothetical protein
VLYENGRYILEVDGTDETIEVIEETASYQSQQQAESPVQPV